MTENPNKMEKLWTNTKNHPWISIPLCVFLAMLIIQRVAIGHWGDWTGFDSFTLPDGRSVPGKTLWDWMQLFIIPGVLAGAAIYFNWQIKEREQERAEDSRRESAMQAYLDRISDLLLNHELARSKPDNDVRTVAQSRTFGFLPQLNGDGLRIGVIVRFLYNANLISGDDPIIQLAFANLDGASLYWANLKGANLAWANLEGANLMTACLRGANLESACLSDALLRNADLSDANLKGAVLEGAHLKRAKLWGANLEGANLERAKVTSEQIMQAKSYKGVTMPDGKIQE
jgi:hypothetical protein